MTHKPWARTPRRPGRPRLRDRLRWLVILLAYRQQIAAWTVLISCLITSVLIVLAGAWARSNG